MRQAAVSSGRRTVLVVPATDPHRIGKALAAGADEVVIDLEDAVPLDAKDDARGVLADLDWTAHPRPPRLAVRVNAPRSAWCHRDLELAAALPIDTVVVPKVESRGDLDFVERLLDGVEAAAARSTRLGIQALIETAAGVSGLADITRGIERLDSLIVGYADLAASLGRRRSADPGTWASVQWQVLVAARTAGIEAVDGPFLGVEVDEAFLSAVQTTASAGFDAKWVIHPRQLEDVARLYAPDPAEVERAVRVIAALDQAAASGRGAVSLDGELIDEAMALAARRIIAKAGR